MGTQYKLPRVFGKYYLLELIAQGGMAEVFKAKMFGVEGFEKIVAIKKILQEIAEDSDFIEMFIDEAKIAVQLQHPNIVQILELGKIDDAYFIAMELVNGRDIKTVRKRLKRVDLLMPVEQSVYTLAQVCDGLDYAHRKTDEKMKPLNIIHRDISPQNMIISYEGTVKLIDFGIAKAKSKSTKTQAGMLKGKFAYMSPEQVAGMAIDRRSDIFSLGVVLFEMLTGKRLFLGKNDVATLEKIKNADVPKPSVFNSAVTPELDRIVLKALAKDRDERYQWASEFAEDLKQFNFRSAKSFSRQDMMDFMKEFFVEEIEEDLRKLDEYSTLEIPEEMRSGLGGSRIQAAPRHDAHNDEYSGVKNKKGPALFITMFLLMVALLSTAGYFMFFATNNTTLIVDSNVSATLITFDEGTMYEKRCATPCTLNGVLEGSHTIDANIKDHLPLTQVFSIKDGEQKMLTLHLYKPGEQKTMLTVKSTPDGAAIFINGEKEEDVTPAIVNVPVGIEILLRTEKSGYKATEKNIGKLSIENNREINFVMKTKKRGRKRTVKAKRKRPRTAKKYKSGDAGYISINSKPWANVYIDGKFIKATPITKYPLKPGRHKIHFKNPKFKINKVFPVTIKPKKSQRMIKNF
ncbi:serine/threonine protein kinase [bacterium]|nr:serine/threonine protein kinase [bacterium]